MSQTTPTTVDTHVHVFDPSRFPYTPDRSYTPGTATVADLLAHLDRVRAGRVVVVQPSVYGTDNSAVLDAVQALGPDVARGVAAIDDTTTDADLAALAANGIVGVRLNVHSHRVSGQPSLPRRLFRLAARLAPLGLFIQVFADAHEIADARDAIALSPVPVLLDHFGGIHTFDDGSMTGLNAVTDLLSLGHVWVKLSAMVRVGERTADLLPGVVETFLEIAPDRLVWGSDWPHTGGGVDRSARGPLDVEPFRDVDDAADLALLTSWLGDAANTVLVDNPSRFFGFPRR